MRRKLIWTLPVAALGATAAVWLATRPSPLAVLARAVERGRVEQTVANTRAGTVEACQRARMSPSVGGQIARLPARRGDPVAAGEILLELWNDDILAELQLAEAEVTAARSRLEEICALSGVARSEARRQESLRRQGVAAAETTERAAGEATAKQASCEAARATLAVSVARAEVVRANLERTRLRAPFAGVVAEVNGELGEVVTPSPVGIPTKPAVDLVDPGCIHVEAPIDEVDAAPVRPGLPVRITLDAFPGETFAGRVERVAPYVLDQEKQARTVEVEVAFDDPQRARELLPGYSADIEVVVAAHDDVVRVPTEAVLEGHRVLVLRSTSGIAEERHFAPGLSNWQYTEVLSGIEPGEQVITSIDREGVASGARVAPETEPETVPEAAEPG